MGVRQITKHWGWFEISRWTNTFLMNYIKSLQSSIIETVRGLRSYVVHVDRQLTYELSVFATFFDRANLSAIVGDLVRLCAIDLAAFRTGKYYLPG